MIVKKLTGLVVLLALPALLSGALVYIHPLLALLIIVPIALGTLCFAFIGLARSQKQYGVAINGVPVLISAIVGATYGSSLSQ